MASGSRDLFEDEDDDFDDLTFSSGKEKRLSLILLLDTSFSMSKSSAGTPIDELNAALESWSAEMRKSQELTRRGEIALITFGDGGVILHQLNPHSLDPDDDEAYVPIARFSPPHLSADGTTPMVEAIEMAIELADRRRTFLSSDPRNIQSSRPLAFMITDGQPTNPSGKSTSDWRSTIVPRLRYLRDTRSLLFFALGVRGSNRSVLEELAPDANYQVSDFNFERLLRSISASAPSDDPVAAIRRFIAREQSIS